MKTLGVIPARLASRRFPRKVLQPILGHPMLAWVYHHARRAACLDDLLVATDSEEIAAYCRSANIPVEMTSAAHRSGTDRVVEVMSRIAADVYVNIQGDEPMVSAEHIDLLVKPFRENPATDVSTLKVALSPEEARDPNNVKVVTAAEGRALYFSRALIPYPRRDQPPEAPVYFKHLGLYAYAASALDQFRLLPPSPLERLEELEQLRFLENGIPITVMEAAEDTVGVDTEEDLRKVEEIFRQRGITRPRP